MKRICMLVILFSVVLAGTVFADEGRTIIGPQALWGPGMSTMEMIRNECGAHPVPDFGTCFVARMGKSGASPQAVEFARLTGNMGYMRDFRNTGKVDIAYVEYPFRANENQGCMLVNGNPPMLDVDDQRTLALPELEKNDEYCSLKTKYPDISFWPGDRFRTEYPVARTLPDGGQRFIVSYRLRNGCHACELIGHARFAFDFDKTGNFQGTRLVGVSKPSLYGDPGKPIRVFAGQEFSIVLASNPTTGYNWQLAAPPDPRIASWLSKSYNGSGSNRVGAGGEEVWIFMAKAPGTTEIGMKYARPWEKDVKPARQLTFKVIVE